MKFENSLGEKIQLAGYFKMRKIICKMIGKKKILDSDQVYMLYMKMILIFGKQK